MSQSRIFHPASTIGYVEGWIRSPFTDIVCQNSECKLTNAAEKIAIYCIHGTVDRPSAFSFIAENLQKKLPKKISSIHLVSFDQRWQGKSIEVFAEQLKNKIINNNHKRVILFGHSRGGLVAAYFAEFLAETVQITVDATFTVGAPFQGTPWAIKPLTWFSDSIKQIEMKSDFLQKLNTKIIRDSLHKYYFFAAKEDWMAPVTLCCVPGETNRLIILEKENHLSILSSQLLASYLKRCIDMTLFKLELRERMVSLQKKLFICSLMLFGKKKSSMVATGGLEPPTSAL